MREKLSAFVVSYNRAALLETCLRALSFVDELIVVDKSSTDDSVAVAARYAGRVEVVPWSPTVEDTREYALSLCRHDWILVLDDDEILTGVSGPYIGGLLAAPTADIYSVPFRHYILGIHDEQAYYWPEARHCLFRRGAVEFVPTVHGGTVLKSNRIAVIPPHSGVCIHHLSHPDVASWIERTNRYTDRADRVRVTGGEEDLIGFAHYRIDYWMERTRDRSANGYPAAVALLRAIYDMVDWLKAWEADRGVDGAALLRLAAERLTRNSQDDVAQALLEHTAERGRLTTAVAEALDDGDAARVETGIAWAETGIAWAETGIARAETVAAREDAATARQEASTARADALAALATAEASARIARLSDAHARELATALAGANAASASIEERLEHLSGSARQFTRQYLPRLWRHLFR